MGLGGDHYMWKPQIDYFSKRPAEFQTLVYDNRGVGFSDHVLGRYTTRGMAQDAIDVMDHVGWTWYLLAVAVSSQSTKRIDHVVPYFYESRSS